MSISYAVYLRMVEDAAESVAIIQALRARVAELEAQCSRVGDINVCLYAELEKLEARVAEYLATIANQDRLVDAQEADIKKLEAERDRLRDITQDLVSLAIPGQNWSDGIAAPVLARARAALAGKEGE